MAQNSPGVPSQPSLRPPVQQGTSTVAQAFQAGGPAPSKVVKKVFYSYPAAGLYITVNHGQEVASPGGTWKRIGEKSVGFSPLNTTEHGGEPYGRFETADPEIIEFLLKREAEVGDIMSEEKFKLHSQKPEEQKRTIEDQNRLIADLQARNAELEKNAVNSRV